jgi:hypothetical protein
VHHGDTRRDRRPSKDAISQHGAKAPNRLHGEKMPLAVANPLQPENSTGTRLSSASWDRFVVLLAKTVERALLRAA